MLRWKETDDMGAWRRVTHHIQEWEMGKQYRLSRRSDVWAVSGGGAGVSPVKAMVGKK